jgi:hypothetical protein
MAHRTTSIGGYSATGVRRKKEVLGPLSLVGVGNAGLVLFGRTTP